MSEIGNLLAGRSRGAKRTLTNDMRKELEVVDLTRPDIKPPAPRRTNAGGGQVGGGNNRFSDFISALQTPAGQKMMGQLAQAFTGGHPQSAGTILGQAGVEQAEGRAIQNFASRLLAGEDVGSIEGMDVGGITPEGIAAAQNIAVNQQESERRDQGLDIEEQRLGLEKRMQALREDSFALDLANFSLDRDFTEAEIDRMNRLTSIEEANAPVNRRLMNARADMLQAEVDYMRSEAASPQQKEELFANTESVVKLIQQQIEPLESELEILNATYRNQLSSADTSEEARNFTKAQIDYIEGRLAVLRSSQVQAMQQLGELTGIDISDLPEREDPVVAPIGDDEEGRGFMGWVKDILGIPNQGSNNTSAENRNTGAAAGTQVGTVNNPIVVPNGTSSEDFQDFFDKQEPGTVGSYNGAMYLKTQQGELEEL